MCIQKYENYPELQVLIYLNLEANFKNIPSIPIIK
jgi:hypothetical protein